MVCICNFLCGRRIQQRFSVGKLARTDAVSIAERILNRPGAQTTGRRESGGLTENQQHRVSRALNKVAMDTPKYAMAAVGCNRDSHRKKRCDVGKFRGIVGRIVELCGTLFFNKFNEL